MLRRCHLGVFAQAVHIQGILTIENHSSIWNVCQVCHRMLTLYRIPG